jgi:hypothetical protein
MTGVIAGIRRRPKLPNPMATMQYVKFYPHNLKGIAFDQPIWVKDLQPTIHFAEIFEPTPAQRYNNYASFMKEIRKERGVVPDG